MFLAESRSNSSLIALSWFALQTKPKYEQITAGLLSQKGYESLTPCYTRRRRRSDRVVSIETPLFPGYTFCRFDVMKRLPVLITPGVVSVVGIGKQPQAIPDHEMGAIETILQSGFPAEPWPYLRKGQRIRIEKGSLTGLEGVVIKKKKDEWRLVVSVTLLQRSVAVELDREWVSAI